MIGGPKNFSLRLLLILAFLAVWEGFVRVFDIPAFILPTGEAKEGSNSFVVYGDVDVKALHADLLCLRIFAVLAGAGLQAGAQFLALPQQFAVR